MSGEWIVAVPAILVAVAFFTIPGLIVRLAGWNVRAIAPYFLAPAISTAIVAVAANVAPSVGLSWSPLPVVVVTAIAAAVAFLLRRWVGPEKVDRPSPRRILAAAGGLVLAGAVITAQLTYVFGSPENISQTFDSIVHLNSIRFALDAGDASAFSIGRTSDIGFYPNAWHSFVTLSAELTGVSVPVAVNATSIAIGAVVWPASCMALAAVLFRERAAALAASAALSTGFGAFPILLLFFGVLYPNTMGYSLVAAGLAALVLLLRTKRAPEVVRASVLLLVVCAGVGLGHPNAFLALFALGTFLTLFVLLRRALRARSRRVWIINSTVALVLLVIGAVLWRYSRTGFAMSRWGAWQSTAQAFGEAVLISPRGYPMTLATAALILIGLVAVARRPKHFIVVVPFAVASFMFILASGVGSESFFRDMVTNPWYNDAFRLAALLPIAGIPTATLGAVTLVDVVRGWFHRWAVPAGMSAVVATIAALALFGVGAGPNVTQTANDARGSYAYSSTSALLTDDERELLSRLDETTPRDAVIAGNPWTGTALAYALAGRDVAERHIYVARDDDEIYLDAHLRDIDDDPRVCEAIDRLGITHVLDFGSQNVFNSDGSGQDRAGLNDLPDSDRLVLVDSEGPGARLFRIEGC
jgi:hypothetical protein